MVLRKARSQTAYSKAGKKRKSRQPGHQEQPSNKVPFPWRAALRMALAEIHPKVWEHCERVAALSLGVLSELKLGGCKTNLTEWEIVEQALMHDIGKVFISKRLMAQKGLSQSEWREFRKHPETGHVLATFLQPYIKEAILTHHERLDGSGYPKGLTAKQLSLASKIIAAVDSYDAMVSKRGYNAPKTPLQAIEDLRQKTGKLYDAAVVAVLAKVINERRQKA